MKKFGVLLAMFVIIAWWSSLPVDAAEENGFHYDTAGVIKDYTGPAGEIVIPATVGGQPVTKISTDALKNKGLTKVEFPNTLREIEAESFSQNELSTIVLPDSVEILASGAFRENRLETVQLSSKLTTIGMYAFDGNQLKTVEIPQGVTTIEEGVFRKNHALTMVTLPNTLTTIGGSAFSNCSLTELELPDSVVTIGDYAFWGNNLTALTLPDSVTTVKSYAFQSNKLTTVHISPNMKTIDAETFSHNRLTTVNIPNGVETIGAEAFYSNQLTNLTLPDSVTTLGKKAFLNNQLRTVQLSPKIKQIAEGVFMSNLLTNLDIPAGVEIIGPSAFENNNLTTVNLPNTVIEIKIQAFGKNNLINITLPSGLSILGNRAFHTNDLQTVTFQGTPTIEGDPFAEQAVDKYGSVYEGMFTEAAFLNKWNSVVSSPQTIFAKYQFDVGFSIEGGDLEPQKVVINGHITEPNALSKEGVLFDGWYTNEGFEEKWNFAIDTVTRPMTLFARWLANVNYIITFQTNGGGTTASQTIAQNAKVTEPTAPTKVGYTFNGWYKDAQFKEQWNFTKDVVTQNMTLYAKWTANPTVTPPPVSGEGSGAPSETVSTYIVQFQTNGGTVIANQTKSYNSKIEVPPIPVREGYTFAGWYVDSALTKEWHFDTDVVRDNLILYAKWMTENKTEQIEIEKEAPPIEESPAEKPIAPACTVSFTDITTSWAREMIEEIAGRCIIKGYSDGTFKPNDPIQRQHVAVLFTRAFDLIPTRNALTFSDVPTSHLYYDAIMKVYQAGIFDGTDGQFKPDVNITRAQMAKVLVQVFNLTSDATSTFQDVPSTHWANNYITILADHGIALGDNGNFRPDESITRAQFVAFMYRAMGMIEK